MKFGRLIQVAIGLAATSGAFVLLSSNALADSSRLGTTTQSSKHEAAASTDSSHQYDQNSQTVANGTDDPTNSSSGDNSATPGGSGQNTSDGTGTPAAITSDDGPSTSDQTVSTNVSKSSSNTTGGISSDPSSPAGPSNGVSAAPPADLSVGAGAAVAPMASLVQDPPVRPVAAAPVQVTFQSVKLAIQPMIINHVAVPTDLADGVPSAPVSATKAPVPAKSNGGLDKLTLVLADVIVPSPFFPTNLPVDRIKLLLSLVTLVALLANLVVMTYGLWLKRGGFATAARSDSPTVQFTTPIATPLLLGYVSAPPRRHSPSLVVSDYKTVKTLFSTLSERRIGI